MHVDTFLHVSLGVSDSTGVQMTLDGTPQAVLLFEQDWDERLSPDCVCLQKVDDHLLSLENSVAMSEGGFDPHFSWRQGS